MKSFILKGNINEICKTLESKEFYDEHFREPTKEERFERLMKIVAEQLKQDINKK